MAKDKKGKGSGTKDACYHKVKSRYSVWPSAYASGALVKCRKVGAANWGNSTKKEEFEGQVLENVGNEPKLKPGSGLGGAKPVYPKGQEPKPTGAKLPKTKKEVTEGKYSKSETYVKGTAPVRATYGGKTESFPKETYKKKSKKVEVDEKYQGMYQSPALTYNRLNSSDEKARMSPGRRAMAKSDELERSEPGSKRAKAQKKAAMQMARNFQSARATKEEVEVSEGDKYDNVGKQAARMSLLNNPGPRLTPEQSAAQKKRLEKKRGMKLDDHPQFKKEEVERGYRVVSTSFKSGDGDPKDDVTIKRQKKVVSGDNLTKKGAERSANARRQEYGAGDAFQVRKTKTTRKRPSNAASEADVKAKIDAKEKKQQKSRAQQSITGMNRAGTSSGKVAAARLKTDKKFNKEEVDKRRAPSELVARLSAKREGHMAQDGPNKAAYDAKQRILKKTKDKMTEEIVRSILDEAGKKCWKGYKKAGTQKLFGKTYNRCVKANEELSIDQQMKISRDYNRMSPEEKKKANQKAVAGIPKGKPKKDTRTDAQKMVDAAYGKRPTNPKGSLGT